MARRQFRGRSHSENGWPYVDADGCRWVNIPGTNVTLQIQNGLPLAILRAFAADYNAYIEPLYDADSCCWTPDNSVATSNHPGGTAVDMRWNSHPFQVRWTFPGKLEAIQALLDWYEGTVFWAGIDWKKLDKSQGGWGSPIDEMHWQMGYGTWDSKADAPSSWVADFVNRKIRPDGYSTYRRGSAPATSQAAQILANATGLSLSRATEILPAVSAGLKQSDCTTWPRIAMWLAQMGHESASFVYTEEIAKNGRYAPYIGRTWIQITWDYNYRAFSKWCFDRGLVPTPDYFVPRYQELSELKWAGIGPAWYWTDARPTLNALSDARNINEVTRLINGGYNGLSDRQTRYNRALTQGDLLLTLLTGEDDELADPDIVRKINELHAALLSKKASRSGYAPDDEGERWPWFELLQNIDGAEHENNTEEQARKGSLPDIQLVLNAARGRGAKKDAAFVARATKVINDIAKANPEYLTPLKGSA